jgi:transcriptional regulator with XRE-family HTH domain
MSSPAPTTIDDVRKTLAANIRRIRAGRFAQEALALEAGLDRTMVSKIERGVTSPSLESILKIANVLGVGVHELLQPVAE